MSLTDKDLEKIKAVVYERADLHDVKLEQIRQKVSSLEKNIASMATKEQLEQIRKILEGDHVGLVEDIEDLKERVGRLESRTV